MSEARPRAAWRLHLHEIIFEADTPAGKTFDVLLLVCIVLSVLAVTLESVQSIAAEYGTLLTTLEWAFTILFTLEYLLRLIAVGRPTAYARSFFGLVDLLAILPTYLCLFPMVAGTQSLIVIRALRLLRIFRVLKLAEYVGEAAFLASALTASIRKITVFLGVVATGMLIMGALMYLIEGPAHGFTSIPQSVYWAIVTMTTVGYGDVTPETPAGKALASVAMLMGYGIIAVPTGIVTVELGRATRKPVTTQCCPECSAEGHDPDARYCKRCAAPLHEH